MFGVRINISELDAVGKIGHVPTPAWSIEDISLSNQVSPPIRQILVFGVTKLACSPVSDRDMGVVYLVASAHTKAKRDSICHACTHVRTLSLPFYHSPLFPLSLSHLQIDCISLNSFSFILDFILLSPSCLFLLLYHMSFISLTFSVSLFFF